MATNLAAYFAEQSQKQNPNDNVLPKKDNSREAHEKGDDNDMGPSVSMALQADDDDSFQKSTFNLKRTRSMGLFDDYIDPTKKLLGKGDIKSGADDKDTTVNSSTKPSTQSYDDDIKKDNDKDNENYDESGNYNDDDNEECDYADDYNSDDSSSLDSNDNEVGGGDNADDDYGNENDDLQRYDSYHRESSPTPSVSPPPADNENFLLPQDDNDLFREPERHVDYLSHEWNESEISNSWKYIILKKKKKNEDLVNAARLENASWRTWAKARNHLKTVSPEAVNWSKDSDVTWLYGPVVCGNDTSEGGNVELGYGSDDETSKRLTTTSSKKKKSKSLTSAAPRPILKKRSVTEIIEENSMWKLNEARKHMNDLRYGSGKYDRDEYDDYDALAAKVNAQYYQSSKNHNRDSDDDGLQNGIVDVANSQPLDTKSVPSSDDHKVPYNTESEDKQGVISLNQPSKSESEHADQYKDKESTALSGILSSSNYKKADNDCAQAPKNRHIHFNDRVEQCMAIGRTFSNSDSSDSEEDEDEEQSNGFFKSDEGSRSEATMHVENRSESSSDEGDDDEDDDDADNAGLFINPTMSRRADSNSHYSVTDTSSQSSAQSKLSINPIIKLLPATTLNYGSDDEASDNSDFNGSYGNAVSHNVNTYRGYDYMYDYNSVYTGDTSSFLPVDNCDVVDLPEGLSLHGAMASDNASNYELNHPAASSPGSNLSRQNTNENRITLSNDTETDSLDSGDQFIENSLNQSSDDDAADEEDEDEDSMSLKRTVSFGKNTNSLRDLTKTSGLNAANSVPTARSFISGQPLVSPDVSSNVKANSDETPAPLLTSTTTSSSQAKPKFLKRNTSSSNFIFDSDSDGNSDTEKVNTDYTGNGSTQLRYDKKVNNDIRDLPHNPSLPIRMDSNKGEPPRSTTLKPGFPSTVSPSPPSASDLSKRFKIKNSSPVAEVGASDVAISGSFSPMYGSAKSIASDSGVAEKNTAKDFREMNKNLETYHIDENKHDNHLTNVNINGGSNESVQKMMQNARDIAQKYLHSWKRTDGKQKG